MFIVIEGLDGCGKATQSDMLKHRLSDLFPSKHITKLSFPDYSAESSHLVKMYLNGEITNDPAEINAYAASMFFAADRYISYKTKWQSNRQNNDIIIADRYVTANQLYQAAKQPDNNIIPFIDWLDDFEYERLQLPRPDIVIMLRLPVAISQKLILARYNDNADKRDIYEADTAYLQRVYDVSTLVAKHCGWTIIDCNNADNIMSKEQISDIILDICLKHDSCKNNNDLDSH